MVRFVDDEDQDGPVAPVIPFPIVHAATESSRPGAPAPIEGSSSERECGVDEGRGSKVRGAYDARTHRDAERRRPDDAERDARDAAERLLLKRLRARALSVAEARKELSGGGVDADEVESLLDEFGARGYLDDAALAEQLVHVGVGRKGQGRRALAQTLAQRRVPRDVADAALAALPDDDAERALEFARSRAARLGDLDEATAMRRLLGQLARRGYGGSIATDAARDALADRSRAPGAVRFR